MSPRTRNEPPRGMPALLGLTVAFLGATVLVSWYVASLRDVTPRTGFVPMQYSTALGFVVSGLAVAAHCVGRRRLALWGGALAASLGSLVLAEHVFGQLGEGLFGVSLGAEGAGRMSPHAAMCFALAGGLLIVWRAPGTSSRWRRLATGVVAAAMVAGGFVGLLGYLANDPSTYGWARFTDMEAHSALGFMGLGTAFFVMVARLHGKPDSTLMPGWAPWAVGAGVATLTLALWTGLTMSDARVRNLAAIRSHEAVMTHTNQVLQDRLRSLERLTSDVQGSGATRNAQLARGAERLLADLPGLVGVGFVEPDGSVRWSAGATDTARLERDVRERPDLRGALRTAGEERQTAVTDPGGILGTRSDLYVFVPVVSGERLTGTLAFEHAVGPFFDAVFADGVGRAYRPVLAADGGGTFYRPRGSPAATSVSAGEASPLAGRIAFGDRVWTLAGRPDPSMLAGGRHGGNALILWFGLFLAVALTVVMRKSEALRVRAGTLGRAKATIEEHALSLREANRSLEEQARHLRGTQNQLTRAAREKRYVLDSLSAFLIGVDPEGRVVEWNSVSTELLGAPVGGSLGARFDALALPWDRGLIRGAVRECLVSGERVRRESVHVEAPGRDPRVVSLTVNPMQTEEGRGCAIIGADVTERQLLELQLQHAQKLESVGTLAAGIAHEINTPMQFVSDNVRFVSESMAPLGDLLALMPEVAEAGGSGRLRPALVRRLKAATEGVDVRFLASELPQALAQTQEGVTRVTGIVRAMKEFSHPGGDGRAPADVNRAIESTLEVARNEYKYHADVETDLEDLPPIECHVADLSQVFLNLLVNAAQAVREKVEAGGPRGVIRVSTRLDGDVVEVRVSDTGAGIPAEARARVFEQFFTTKEVGRGTGLGLSIARAVVEEKHGGTIRFETEPGAGTTFIVRIPRSASVEAPAA